MSNSDPGCLQGCLYIILFNVAIAVLVLAITVVSPHALDFLSEPEEGPPCDASLYSMDPC